MDTAWTVRRTAQNSGSRLTKLRAAGQLRARTEDRDRINIDSDGLQLQQQQHADVKRLRLPVSLQQSHSSMIQVLLASR